MSKQSRCIQTLPVIAAVALTANRFVSPTGGLPAAGGNTLGVALSDTAQGDACPVERLGTAKVVASAAIAKGAAIESLDDGRAVTRTTGVTCARALEAATVAGQIIEVALIPN